MLEQIVELARRHNLVLMSDEIYDKILYDDATHTSTAALAPDVLTLTFNGLSKAYRVAGFRSGWLILSGPRSHAASYIEGLNILANMRLCPNVPSQHAIQTALGGYQSINDLVLPGGRLLEQRDAAVEALNAIPGVTCVQPRARCTSSRGSTRRRTRSMTTCSSRSTCSSRKRSWWCRDRVQLVLTGPPADRDAAAGGRAHRGDRADRPIPRGLRAAAAEIVDQRA